jgi:hypothetical protein
MPSDPRPIALSIGCPYAWKNPQADLNLLNNTIEQALPRLDGVEVFADYLNVKQLAEDSAVSLEYLCLLSPDVKTKLLNLPLKFMHLAALKELSPGRESWLVETPLTLQQRLGYGEFTIHADEVNAERFKQLHDRVPPELLLSFENMDPRKKNFRTPSEMAAFQQCTAWPHTPHMRWAPE